MFHRPDLELELGRHQERIAAAQRQRLVIQARRANTERKAQATRQQRASTAPSDGPIPSRRHGGLTDWLIRVGDIVVQFSPAELDEHRRPALGVLVDELLNTARERGADVPSNTAGEDSAVVVLRTLGRLAASTTGRSIPVSRRRARTLRTALDDFVNGHHVHVTQSCTEPASTRSRQLAMRLRQVDSPH